MCIKTKEKKMRFTLIELLFVVAILAILMSLLLPSLRDARMASQVAVCLSNQAQIGKANYIHCRDNNGKFPRSTVPGNGTHAYKYKNQFYNIGVLHTYLINDKDDQQEVFYCPTRTDSPLYRDKDILPMKGHAKYWGGSSSNWRGDYVSRFAVDFIKGKLPDLFKSPNGLTITVDFWYKSGVNGYPDGFGQFFHGGIKKGVSALFIDGSASIKRPGSAPFKDGPDYITIEQKYLDFFDK
jgi:prepilin-type N-terminal cleavage/methylation domain-containing protein